MLKIASNQEKEIIHEALSRFSSVCELILRSTSQSPEENYQHLAEMQSKWLSDTTFGIPMPFFLLIQSSE